jgi:hypothetical protein
MDIFDDIPISVNPIVLGVLGTHNTITKQQMHEKILHPLMSVLGRVPELIVYPSEGTSSAYVSIWAQRHNVNTHCVEADWRKFQRKASILRDARILKESTHLLVFIGTKSRTNEQTAIRQVKKGKQVFLVEPNPVEMCELVVEE